MRKRLTWVLLVVPIVAGSAFADDRLAMFEMFGRNGCGNCNAAGEVVTVLQEELRGRAVLLEYDYDLFLHGRQDRFWATGDGMSFSATATVAVGPPLRRGDRRVAPAP
ncbi:MAG TPA: hypothetical protein VLT32_20290 [Candidatus Sulfomarinibacteraceae bacterium]|nr:hypothetical protein [Candidatus Sulfomarinibacteraceae bacterium]